MKQGKKIFIALFSFLLANAAHSWDGIVTGKVIRCDVADSQEGFRIVMEGGPLLCSNVNWAYISRAQPAYQTYVSVLLAAQMTGKSVTVYSNKDAGGLCQIGYIVMQ